MLEWKEEFCIGVESIDHAHETLFTVVNKVYKIIKESGDIEWAASQAIKYFESYTLKHFSEEEEYMLSIEYKDYERHKKIHDGMRDLIIPALNKKLEDANYSIEAIREFLDICTKWLRKHILEQDKAIMAE